MTVVEATMTLHPSASALEAAYDRLHPLIRKWIRDQGWDELREIQARAIVSILSGTGDAVIAAATAAGKTEAAFLPVLTVVADRLGAGFSVVYISPLKALINDQFRRLDELCERIEIPVVKWHGDASQAEKKKAYARPKGIALITPESIEAMFVRRPADAYRLLGSADFILIDELHAFLQGPRGLHVASLLRRIDAISSAPARRIGLSATIGDLQRAAAWLRPGRPEDVEILEAKSDSPELRLQVRGYVEPPDLDDQDRAEVGGPKDDERGRVALDDIADHQFEHLRGANNLVFGGSRRTVEATADRLRRRCERANVPNEFFPHHGSLSKSLREELEERLKAGELPTTAVCTSTLELGIDIGSVKSVAQIGAPRCLSSLRQRLGRTGRRKGVPSILRVYVREPHIDSKSSVLDELRIPTVRSVAAVRLLLKSFVEPPGQSRELASTLIHQVLSVVAERGGINPAPLYALLCGPGPFGLFTQADFAMLLRSLGAKDVGLLEQAPDGTLMLGAAGETIVQSRDFFAVFEALQEWRLVSRGRTLGTLPISTPVHIDGLVVFAGRRWIIQGIDEATDTLEVAPHAGGVVPRFEGGEIEPAHDRLIGEMRSVYEDTDVPLYLDANASRLLREGRDTFVRLDLAERSFVDDEGDVHLFLWRGSDATVAFGAGLAMAGLPCGTHDLGVTVPESTATNVRPFVERMADRASLSEDEVARFVKNVRRGKFAEFVPEALGCGLWARQNRHVVAELPEMAKRLLVR